MDPYKRFFFLSKQQYPVIEAPGQIPLERVPVTGSLHSLKHPFWVRVLQSYRQGMSRIYLPKAHRKPYISLQFRIQGYPGFGLKS